MKKAWEDRTVGQINARSEEAMKYLPDLFAPQTDSGLSILLVSPSPRKENEMIEIHTNQRDCKPCWLPLATILTHSPSI